MAAADPNSIIVVNTCPYRCDAFLIQRNQIMLLELPRLMLNKVQERAKNL